MGLWSRYIAWLDRDIDASMPTLLCWSSVVPILPFVPVIVVGLWWQPAESDRLLILPLPLAMSFALLGIWIWRVVHIVFLRPPGPD